MKRTLSQSRSVHVILAVALSLATPAAHAEETGIAQTLEGLHTAVHEQTVATARWFDRLFADEEYEAERTDASLRLRFDANFDEDGVSFGFSPRVRAHLPYASRRLMLELEGEGGADRQDGALDVGDFFDDENDNDSLELRIRRIDPSGRTRVSPEVGVGWNDGQPRLMGGVRVSREWRPSDGWRFYGSERLRANTDYGIESLSLARADRVVWENDLLRADLNFDWRADEPGFNYSPSLILYHPLTPTSALAYEVTANLWTDSTDRNQRYYAGVRYRFQALTEWTTFEIVPRVDFYEDNDYQPTLGLLLRLDAEF